MGWFGLGRFKTQEELCRFLVDKGMLKSPSVIEAFYTIDRSKFMLQKNLDYSYYDRPVSIGYEATISQPTTIAFMIELLSPKKGEKILDIGSGSGYSTALLAHTVGEEGKIIGVDIIPELVKFGNRNLSKYEFSNVENILCDELGYKKESPYDKILVSAEADHIPVDLIDQLKPGGTIVIPIDFSLWKITKGIDDKLSKEVYMGFVFVPLKMDFK